MGSLDLLVGEIVAVEQGAITSIMWLIREELMNWGWMIIEKEKENETHLYKSYSIVCSGL